MPAWQVPVVSEEEATLQPTVQQMEIKLPASLLNAVAVAVEKEESKESTSKEDGKGKDEVESESEKDTKDGNDESKKKSAILIVEWYKLVPKPEYVGKTVHLSRAALPDEFIKKVRGGGIVTIPKDVLDIIGPKAAEAEAVQAAVAAGIVVDKVARGGRQSAADAGKHLLK